MVHYYKWLIRCLLGILLLGLTVTPSLATNPVVTITVSAWVVGTPGGLILTYINEQEIDISWTKGIGANNTMIRGEYGSPPTSRTDSHSYLVYYGDGNHTVDTLVNLDDPPEEYVSDSADDLNIYYRLWSQNADGSWEETGITGWIEGVGMTFIGLIMLCGLLIIAGFWRRSQAMLWVAALTWIGFSFWQRSITPAWGTWDIHEIMFYVGFLLAIVCIVEAVLIYREEAPEEEKPAPKSASQEYWDRYNEMMAGVRASSTRIKRRR